MPPCSPNDPDPVPDRDPDRRRARAWTALGFLTGCTLVWGSIAALNHWFLGFHAWPSNDAPKVERLVLVDPAPVAPARGSSRGRAGVAPGDGTPTTLFPAGGPALAVVTSPSARPTPGAAEPVRIAPSVGTSGGTLAPGSATAPSAEPRSRGVSPTSTPGVGEPGTDQIRGGAQPTAQVAPPAATPAPATPATPPGAEPQRVDVGRTDPPAEGDDPSESDAPQPPADQPSPDVPTPAAPADPPAADPTTGGVEAPEEPPVTDEAPVAETPAPEAAAPVADAGAATPAP